MTFSINIQCHYAENIMLGVAFYIVMLGVVMLNAVLLSAIYF